MVNAGHYYTSTRTANVPKQRIRAHLISLILHFKLWKRDILHSSW